MARLGLRTIRKPNIEGSSLIDISIPHKNENSNLVETRIQKGVFSEIDKLETLELGQPQESGDKVETNWRQSRVRTGDKTRKKVEKTTQFSSLVGLQRKLVFFLYKSSQAMRSSKTEKLSIEHIALSCETCISSMKKTLQRLENKNIIARDTSELKSLYLRTNPVYLLILLFLFLLEWFLRKRLNL